MIEHFSGNGNIEMNDMEEKPDSQYPYTRAKRPLQQFYSNKSDEDGNTVKQV